MPKGENNRRLSDADRAEIVRLYTTPLDDGTWMGVTTIAKRFGVSHNAIQHRLKREGVKLRSAKEAHAHGKRCKPIVNLPSGPAPDCGCGCGNPTEWNQRRNEWRAYVDDHYRPHRRYHDLDYLYQRYVVERATVADIAADFDVSPSSVTRYLKLHGIPRRDRSDSRKGRMVGEKNPAWRGGVAKWNYSSDWKMIARQIRRRDNWTCQDCGTPYPKSSRDLHVHHIDEDKSNNGPENLVCLCGPCHRERHRQLNRARSVGG